MSTLGTLGVLSVHLHIPPAGGFYCEVTTDGPKLPALDAATLTIGDLALVGRVTSAGHDDHPIGGALGHVVFEGGAGWALPLARAGSYDTPGGTRLSTVLRDLATLAGETYDAPPDVLLPDGYQWRAGTKGRAVLADLVARGAVPLWRVAPATGRTRFDAWPSTGAADAMGRVLKRNLARGRRTVGLDARVAAFLPGGTIEGVAIARLRLTEDRSKLEVETYDA